MATLIVNTRVSNFETWKAGFDRNTEARRAAGFVTTTIHQDPADPLKVLLVHSVGAVEKAHSFARSPEARAAMEKAGVLETQMAAYNDHSSLQY